MGLGVCVAVWSATLVGEGATAIGLLPDKRFLASLCAVRHAVRHIYSVTHTGERVALYIVRRDRQ